MFPRSTGVRSQCAQQARCSASRIRLGSRFQVAGGRAPASPARRDGADYVNNDRPQAVVIAREFIKLGFKIFATGGSAILPNMVFLRAGAELQQEGRISSMSKNKEIGLLINTPSGKRASTTIRISAKRRSDTVSYPMAAAMATVKGINARRKGDGGVKSIQDYHAGM